ncbi:HAD family hydrolase [Streptomyces sp. cg36]|uniref:HAD family hydrolase n=1 Tax=Streptomyces sp. cg36 TaxID=3238798 RepID=UPI0034E295E0
MQSAPRRVALFDVDDTLTDRRAAFDLWAHEFAQRTSVPVQWLTATDMELAGRRTAFFARLKKTYPAVARSVAELHDQYRHRSAELVPFRPDVRDALGKVRAEGWAVGAVTNGEPAAQRLKLKTAQLDDLVDSVIVSGAYGIRKPDPRLFHLAIEDLRATADAEVWMVGDDLTTDIAGGQAAGINTVWLSHGRNRPVGAPEPSHTVHGVTEAASWLLARTGASPVCPATPSGPRAS